MYHPSVNRKGKDELHIPLAAPPSNYSTATTPGNHEKTGNDRFRSTCWSIWWSVLFLIAIAAEVVILYFISDHLQDLFAFVHEWPLYDYGENAKGIFAVGKTATGIVAIGQKAYGIISIGQMAFGLVSVGQVGCGALFSVCQIGGGLGLAIGQMVVATKVPFAQIGFGIWNVGKVQLGFNLLSSRMGSLNDLVVKCTCCDKVKRAAHGLMRGLRYPSYWPQEHKQWMATAIREKDVEDVITEYVAGATKGGYHGLNCMSENERQMVIARLVTKKVKFKRLALRNFSVDVQLAPV